MKTIAKRLTAVLVAAIMASSFLCPAPARAADLPGEEENTGEGVLAPAEEGPVQEVPAEEDDNAPLQEEGSLQEEEGQENKKEPPASETETEVQERTEEKETTDGSGSEEVPAPETVEENEEGAEEEEEAPAAYGSVLFSLTGDGGALSITKDEMAFLTARTKETALHLEDAWGDRAVLTDTSVSVTDKEENALWEGDSISISDDGFFVVEEEAVFYLVQDGALVPVEEAAEAPYGYAMTDGSTASIVLTGLAGETLSYDLQAEEGFTLSSYEVPGEYTEKEKGILGTAVFTENGESAGHTFTFEKEAPSKKSLMKAPLLGAGEEGTGKKIGVLFEDMTYVVMDEGTDLEGYISQYGQVVHTDENIEANIGTPLGGQRGSQYYKSIKKIIFDTDVRPDGSGGQDFRWFRSHSELEEIEGTDRIDTSTLTTLSAAFAECSKLQSLDLNSWDVSNVTDMSYMFIFCSSLKEMDIGRWNVEKVTSFSGTFSQCTALENLNISRWKTFSATSFNGMFSSCSNLKALNLNLWYTTNVRDINYMFSGCSSLKTLNLSSWDTSNMTSMNLCFANCSRLEFLNISGWDFMKSGMNGFDTFFNCMNNGTYFNELNARNLKIPGDLCVRGCTAQKLDFAGTYAPNMSAMAFTGDSRARIIDISSVNAPNLSDISGAFAGLSELERIIGIESLNTRNLRNAYAAFASCSKLKTLNLSAWSTGELENASIMFASSGVKDLLVSTWDTRSLKYAESTFGTCKNLETLNLSNWDTTNISNMSNIMSGDENLKTIVLGEKFAFKAGQRGLPYPDWEHVESGTKVADLWNNYQAEELPGIYTRVNLVSELTTQNIDEIKYDQNKKEITVYVDTEGFQYPAVIDVPSLYNRIRLDPALAAKVPALKAVLENAADNGTYADLDLKLTMAVKTYADITSCSYADNMVWTFDVPKDNKKVFRLNIFKYNTGNMDPVPYGYIENTKEDPKTFTLYDAAGNAIRQMSPNERNTYNDIGFGAPSEGMQSWTVNNKSMNPSTAAKEVYPEYTSYISYNRYMDNYEVVMAPGKYHFETSVPEAISMQLTPVAPSAGEGDVTNDPYYTFLTPGTTDTAYLTVFNVIKKDAYGSYGVEHLSLGVFKKKDKLTGRGVPGAVYKFTSLDSGTVYYGVTDYRGEIGGSLGTSFNGTSVSGSYRADLYEEFIAEEVKAPEGYYINTEKVKVCFLLDHYVTYHNIDKKLLFKDGISVPRNQFASYLRNNTCVSCDSGHDDCVCGDFGRCRCYSCGVPSVGASPTYTYYSHEDLPCPELKISKKDASGNELPGAVLQLIDKETKQVVHEWTSTQTPYTYKFGITGHAQIPYGESKTFIIHEKQGPSEYYTLGDDVEVTVAYNARTVTASMTNSIETIDVKVKKDWNTTEALDVSEKNVQVQLIRKTVSKENAERGTYGDWEDVGSPVTLNARGGWEYTFSGQYKNRNGWPIQYSVRELSPGGFVVGVSQTAQEDGKAINVSLTNTSIKVPVEKKDEDGSFVAGSHLQILDADRNVVHEWDTAAGQAHLIEGILAPGSYTLHESAAPEGYELAQDIPFTIGNDGRITSGGKVTDSLSMIDAFTLCSFKVKKTVTGSFGSRDKQFEFSAVFTKADGTPYTKAIHYKKGSEEGTLTPDAAGKVEFTLSHGDEIEFSGIVYGTKYSVTEKDYSSLGYTTTSENASGTVVSGMRDVKFVNENGMVVPTGNWLPGTAAMPILLAGAAAICLILYRKKKKN